MPVLRAIDKPVKTEADLLIESVAIDLVTIARTEPFVRAHQLITRRVRQLVHEIGKVS
jgi:hypothetical protein